MCEQESTLHLVLRLRGGGTSVRVLYKGKEERVWLTGSETISYVKKELHRSLGIPTERQVLAFEGQVLHDGNTSPTFTILFYPFFPIPLGK
jgi:hypothetical protein